MVLFITRKYPPSVGGMENFSAGLANALGGDCIVLSLGRSQVHLPWWIPFVCLRALLLSPKVNSIHIGDGVLAWLGVVLTWITRKPISITVHGLDLTYSKFGYQAYVWPALKRYHSIIVVSKNTERILLEHGIEQQCVTVIPNGINSHEWATSYTRADIDAVVKKQLPDSAFIMITVGRLIQRKGVAWFLEKVMSELPANAVYLIAGTGPDQERIQSIISEHELAGRVYMLGRIDDESLKKLYAAADVFIMPNIEVVNDVEGFGIVAIEAGASGVPVIAANVEGMQDIFIDESTGFLVESNSAEAWRQAISSLMSSPRLDAQHIKQITAKRFSWDTIARQYRDVFNSLIK